MRSDRNRLNERGSGERGVQHGVQRRKESKGGRRAKKEVDEEREREKNESEKERCTVYRKRRQRGCEGESLTAGIYTLYKPWTETVSEMIHFLHNRKPNLSQKTQQGVWERAVIHVIYSKLFSAPFLSLFKHAFWLCTLSRRALVNLKQLNCASGLVFPISLFPFLTVFFFLGREILMSVHLVKIVL